MARAETGSQWCSPIRQRPVRKSLRFAACPSRGRRYGTGERQPNPQALVACEVPSFREDSSDGCHLSPWFHFIQNLYIFKPALVYASLTVADLREEITAFN